MKYIVFLYSFFICLCVSQAQYLLNPSLEGIPTFFMLPPNWTECNDLSTPDTQPGFGGVVLSASEGQSYISMVTRGNNGFPNDNKVEACEAELIIPLSSDTIYLMSLDLAYFPDFFGGVLFDRPVKLKIWGYNSASGSCLKTDLLWESPVVSDTLWKIFEFLIHPKSTHNKLILEANYESFESYNGNILIDNFMISSFHSALKRDTMICKDETIIIDANINMTGATYLWNTGDTTTHITVGEGHYSVDINFDGKELTETIDVIVYETVAINLGKNRTICQGDSLILNVSVANGRYFWSNNMIIPQITIKEEGLYQVKVTTACQELEDEIFISFLDNCCQIDPPNVFTPNGDGINDKFEIPFTIGIENYYLEIFNRWGQIIFRSNNINQQWDGKIFNIDAPTGIYYWTITKSCFLTPSILNHMRGTITLLR